RIQQVLLQTRIERETGGNVPGIRFQREALVVQQQPAALQREMIDRKIEYAVEIHGRPGLLYSRLRNVRRTIGIDDQVNDRAINVDRAKRNFGFEQCQNSHANSDMIDMHIGLFSLCFKTMNGETRRFELQTNEMPAKAVERDVPTGGA